MARYEFTFTIEAPWLYDDAAAERLARRVDDVLRHPHEYRYRRIASDEESRPANPVEENVGEPDHG